MSQGNPRTEGFMRPFQSHVGGRRLPGNVDHWNPYNMLYAVVSRLNDADAEKCVASWCETCDRNSAAFGAEIASKMAGDRIVAEYLEWYRALMMGNPLPTLRENQ